MQQKYLTSVAECLKNVFYCACFYKFTLTDQLAPHKI